MSNDSKLTACHGNDTVVLKRSTNGCLVFIKNLNGQCEEVKFFSGDKLSLNQLPREFRKKYKTAASVNCIYLVFQGEAGVLIPSVPGAGGNVVVQLSELATYPEILFRLVALGPMCLPKEAFDYVVPDFRYT